MLASSLLVQKHIHDQKYLIRNFNRIFGYLLEGRQRNFFTFLFVYYLQAVEISDEQFFELIENIPTKHKKDVMSTYEIIEQKGMYKAKVKTIINGHNRGLSIEILSALTDLTENEVQKIIDEHNVQN